ncbi:hypothetical protein [Lactobacillus phage Lbab1]|nr:hypothetical protein [Lactobacillus phage Lbab1]
MAIICPNKFNQYLEDHNLEIYDVAKMMRDSPYNKSKRTRQAYVRLLRQAFMFGWSTVNALGGGYEPGVHNGQDGGISAKYVAKIIGCKVQDIVGG